MHSLSGLSMKIGTAILSVLAVAAGAGQPASSLDVKLYAMDCGRFDFKDLSSFSDTGEYDRKSGCLADACFLIHDPKGWLLWDTGLSDALIGNLRAVTFGGSTMSRDRSIVAELKRLDLRPDDITYVGFAHLHADHSGNANLFLSSTWLLQRKELQFAIAQPAPIGVEPSTFSDYPKVKMKLLDGDYDVFGDGMVQILSAPGHTPGHQVLLVKLRQKGNVILAGDLYHIQQSRMDRLVPVLNTSRAETLASMDRIERLAVNLKAKVIVQHSIEDFAQLLRFPEAWQ
jgi:N-acyl homoserine lactone hydrolase